MGKATTFKDTRDTIDLFNTRFNENVTTRQNSMWSVILRTVKNLETDAAGNILTNNSNLKILRTLRGDLENVVIDPQYKKNVNTYLNSFEELKGINDKYYKSIASSGYTANKHIYKEVLASSAEATSNSLLESGISESVIKPIERVLSQNITTGANFVDLTDTLRREILGSSTVAGKLERYTKQITTDALNQFNANYNQAVSKDLALVFYFYNGALKETSRQYCKDMVNEGRYFHKIEVEDSASREWSGKIPGTGPSNIITNRGGFNCGHQWLAVDALSVPGDVVARNIANGNYQPTKKDDPVTFVENTAKKEGRQLQNRAEGIGAKSGGGIKKLNLKSRDSILRKMKSGDKLSDIKDSYRTTIYFDANTAAGKSKIRKVINDYNKSGVVSRVKNQVTPMGYTGTIINTNSASGLLGEVQVNTARMIYAKEPFAKKILGKDLFNSIKRRTGQEHGLGHTFYEDWRKIMDVKGKIPTDVEKRIADKLVKQSIKYYSHFK